MGCSPFCRDEPARRGYLVVLRAAMNYGSVMLRASLASSAALASVLQRPAYALVHAPLQQCILLHRFHSTEGPLSRLGLGPKRLALPRPYLLAHEWLGRERVGVPLHGAEHVDQRLPE